MKHDFSTINAAPTMTAGSPEFAAFADAYLTPKIPATTAKARHMATDLHAGQTDQTGHPYIEHPAAVVARLEQRSEYQELNRDDQQLARIAAWLHDTVEDTALTVEDLTRAGFSTQVQQIVAALTSHPGEDRDTYYARVVSAGPIAVAVKLADLDHNSDPQRRLALPGSPINPVTDMLDDRYTRLGRKYAKAYAALNSSVPAHLQAFLN
jgi:hypothetical protein